MDAALTKRLRRMMEVEFDRGSPPDGFPHLPDIPAGRYVDPEFFELEQRHLWPHTWVMAAHVDELPEPRSYRVWEDGGQPIILVRGADGEVRAFYNTCRHRGANLVKEPEGKARTLVCQYHGWTYDLTGKLVGVPDEHDFVDLDKSCRSLVPVRCEIWAGWIFINRDPDAPPLREHLGSIPDQVADFQPESLVLLGRKSVEIACNWKAVMDAFLEVYHLKHIHPYTVDKLLDHRGSVMTMFPTGCSRMVTPNRDWLPSPAGRGFPEIETVGEVPRISNVSFHVFPNFVTPLDHTGFPILLFWPLDIRTTRMDVIWFGPAGTELPLNERWQQRLELFEVVLEEDTRNLRDIQKSLESPAFRGVPLSYQERRIYFMHEEIDRRIGAERIPERLRMQPMMRDWVEPG